MGKPKIAVVIPCYKVTSHVLDVIADIGPEVSAIFAIDDACPEGSGHLILSKSKDKRVKVIFHEQNQGVGGAVVSGYRAALDAEMDIIVKVDGDGQMNPQDLPALIKPIVDGRADYTKGNRFDSVEDIEAMPKIRIIGNAALSLLSKVSSGYWNITDPTNGYTAIHANALRRIKLDKLSKRYFFESDMLFRLSLIRAVVFDISLPARYGNEKSNLKISRVLFEFPYKHFKNHLKRILYQYYLRDWSVASLELPAGLLLFIFGFGLGIEKFIEASEIGVATTAGNVMLAVLPMLLGFQLILAFVNYDVSSVPDRPRQLEV